MSEHAGAQLLPDGLSSANTWLMIICDDGHAPVGTLWIGPHPEHGDCAFIYDIEVDESRRGEGLGRASTAQRLYTSLDYHVLATQMTKRLE